MCMICQAMYGVTAATTFVASTTAPVAQANQLNNFQKLPEAVAQFSVPSIEKPDWYQKQVNAAAQQAEATQKTDRVVTYTISTKGTTSANLSEFAAQVNETLNDSRGWSRLGVMFRQAESGGNFNFVL